MSTDLVDIFLLSLVRMVSPTLLVAVTVMLLLPNPKQLMLGYLLGAYLTSVGLGLLIVFSLNGSSFEATSKHAIGPDRGRGPRPLAPLLRDHNRRTRGEHVSPT